MHCSYGVGPVHGVHVHNGQKASLAHTHYPAVWMKRCCCLMLLNGESCPRKHSTLSFQH